MRTLPLLMVLTLAACNDDSTGEDTAVETDTDTSPTCAPALEPTDDGTSSNGGVGIPDLVISEVDPGAFIELYNTTNAAIVLSGETFAFCEPFNYIDLDGTGVTVPAGGYATINWPTGFVGSSDSSGEIMLYSQRPFGTDTNILDYVCWGSASGGRKSQAESMGKWSGNCAAALTNGAIRRDVATSGTSLSDYDTTVTADASNCTP